MGGWRTFRRSLGWACRGVIAAVRTERHMRFHAASAAVVLMLAGWLGVGGVRLALVLLCIGFVVAMELMNTAVEKTVDLAMPQQHPLAKFAKDAAAGAVLVAAATAAAVGVVVFGPPFAERMGFG